MEKSSTKQRILKKYNIPYHLYNMLISLLIGVGIGLVIIGIVAFATRESRPTQYVFLLIRNATGINLLDQGESYKPTSQY